MKPIFFICLLVISCKSKQPYSPHIPSETSYKETSDQKIILSAKRYSHRKRICFKINLKIKEKMDYALLSNWTAVWIDKQSRYHFLSLNQKNPAASPKFKSGYWENNFRTCTPTDTKKDHIHTLVFTPKETFYNRKNFTLELKWN